MASAWTHLGSILGALDTLQHAAPKDRQKARDRAEREVQKLICHHGLLPSKGRMATQMELSIEHDTARSLYANPIMG